MWKNEEEEIRKILISKIIKPRVNAINSGMELRGKARDVVVGGFILIACFWVCLKFLKIVWVRVEAGVKVE